MRARRGRNNGSRLFVVVICTAIFALRNSLNFNRVSINDRQLEQEDKPMETPVVYTFVDPERHPYVNDKLLQTWTSSWESAGFSARILTMKSIEQHSKYDEYSQRLEELHKSTWASIGDWHEKNLLRFIAMSTVEEGGVFAEPLIIPLNNIQKDLPNEGKFTMHNGVQAGLMSGNKDEWNRVTELLMHEYTGKNLVRTIVKLHESHMDHFLVQDSTFSAKFPTYDEQYSVECNAVKDKIAVVFTVKQVVSLHSSLSEDNLEFMQMFEELYIAQCNNEGSKTSSSERPKIHTFFASLDKLKKEKNDGLAEMWKDYWSKAGWDPVVLTIDDARRHPAYDEFNATLQNGTLSENVYDQFCYFRWLAMAASGGGWMSDIDTFPLNIKPEKVLPNDGKFTGFSNSVPCLVSGSEFEWNRMASLLIDSYRKNGHNFWSDMLAMSELREKGEYIARDDVTTFGRIYPKNAYENENAVAEYFTEEMCEKTQSKVAHHFSHNDITMVAGNKDRMEVIFEWMGLWENKCL